MTHLRTLLLLLLGLVAAACSSPDTAPEGQAIPVRTITVGETDLDNILELPGSPRTGYRDRPAAGL